MGDTLGIVSLYSHAWEWTISTNGLMTVRASSATYIITLPASPSLRRRPHCLVEVVWGQCSWLTAIAMPRWVNIYSCHALLHCICGPVLESGCKAFLNGFLMTAELVECQTGSFFHINISWWQVSDFIVEDVENAITCRLYTAHLAVQCLTENQRLMSVFVPQGLTCYTSSFFSCIADSKHWESTLFATGRIAFPGMEADKLQFFPVHSSFEEQAKQLDTHQRHFIMVDSDQVDGDRRCIVVAIFTPAYQWIGACFWPATTTRWELLDLVCRGKHWHAYQNCQCLTKQKTQVSNGDSFSLYEQVGDINEAPTTSTVPTFSVSPFGNPATRQNKAAARPGLANIAEDCPTGAGSTWLDLFQ